MQKLGIITGVLGILVVMPIWFYLQYQILIRVQATELMMFLFWVYLPCSLLIGIINKISVSK